MGVERLGVRLIVRILAVRSSGVAMLNRVGEDLLARVER